MFDGTDLSLAYGSSYDNSMNGGMGGMGGGMGGMGGMGSGMGSGMGGGSSMSNPQQSMMHNPVPVASEQVSIPKSTASHQVVPDVPYVVPETIYTKQNSGGNYNNSKVSSHQMNYNESFWDRLANKKWEVFKLFVMALIIMLGLSLHGVVNHYLDKYIGSSFLTEMQEVAIRLSYPVAIILFIWIVKASA